ncbi:MAG: glycosyltransferase [Lapillicoccus sp.]
MERVEVAAKPLELLGELLPVTRRDQLTANAARARDLLAGRVVWNVSATAEGGGVAEMLHTLLAYTRGAGIDTRWMVLDGDPEFFAITKRIHNSLHGASVDGEGLGPADHEHYERVLRGNLAELTSLVRRGDVVLLHDPQTAGLVPGMRAIGAHVIWRSHIGRDDATLASDRGWAFLRGYVQDADAFVFSRRRYVPGWVPADRVRVIAPSIDPFSAKNRHLDDVEVRSVLRWVGLIDAGSTDAGSADGGLTDGGLTDGPDQPRPVEFTRRDGTTGVVRRHTDLMPGAPLPASARLVVQVSRWDLLKDMAGVLSAFADAIVPATTDVHLVLAGPDVSGVSDDPEGAQVLAACRSEWARLPEPARDRCHLACIPMDDVDENAIIVNALQRRATVVVQKSLQEGFGLTVTEAMWKSRPMVASAVGGIQEQITDGQEGLLLPDPRDLTGFAVRLQTLLDDPTMAERLGRNAHARVLDEFVGDQHLIHYVDLFADLVTQRTPAPPGRAS